MDTQHVEWISRGLACRVSREIGNPGARRAVQLVVSCRSAHEELTLVPMDITTLGTDITRAEHVLADMACFNP